jgi:hypothetical protein
MNVFELLTEFETRLLPKVNQFIDQGLVPFLILFTGGLILIYVGYTVIVSMVDIESKMDPYILIRPILVLVGLKLYTVAVPIFFLQPVEILNDIVNQAAFAATNLDVNSFDEAYKGAITHVQDGVYDVVQVNPFMEFLHMLLYFLAVAASAYILFRQLLVKTIYYMLGVLVLPISLVLGNKDAFKTWALGYLSVLLWGPLLSIVKMMIILLRVDSVSFTEVILSIAFQLLMVFSVLAVPQYARILIEMGVSSALGGNLGSGSSRGLKGVLQSPVQTAKNLKNKFTKL